MFSTNSRYARQPVATFVDRDGRSRPYVTRREVPQPPPASAPNPVHIVLDGDRLDRVTWKHLGDPELFWRMCDANGALQPEELTAVAGRRLVVPLDNRAPQP
jgi:hypothetical protein